MSDPATTTADPSTSVSDDATLSGIGLPDVPPPAGLLQAAGGTIPRARVPTGLLTHGGITIGQFFGTQMIGLAFPLAAGAVFYGWRAIVATAAVVGTAMVATVIWRRAGWRGAHLRYPHVAWMALLLALMLPAHLAADAYFVNKQLVSPWPMLPAAGIGLVVLLWLLGGVGPWRIHPVLVTYLLLLVAGRALFVPHAVLQRSHVVTGDIFRTIDAGETVSESAAPTVREPWNAAPQIGGVDAIRSEPAAQRLTFFTTGREPPEGSFLSLEALLRDRMPPLEDLIIGAAPGAIGAGSAVAVIIGGLFLLYRGMIDYRIPLLVFLAAYVGMLVLPVPVVIHATERTWRWLAIRDPSVGWPLALTFVNYEVVASPLLFTALFLATAPSVRPLARRARVIYAVLIGLLAAAFQLYTSVAIGPYVALLVVSLLTPVLDRLFAAKTLV